MDLGVKLKRNFPNMQELIPVNVIIGDRNYRVRVTTQDEEMVRRVIRRINEQILQFKTLYAGKDMQDYVAMVLLWFVTEQQEEGKSDEDQSISEKLDQLSAFLDKQLKG